MNKIPLKIRVSTLIFSAAFIFVLLFSKPVITQDQSYHQFVDQRFFFGIPNAQDVLSNIFFLVVGFLGLLEITGNKGLLTKKSWFWFFLSIVLIAPGSAYYHWSPNNSTLIWDRLPMSMGFMALYIVLLSEHIHLKIEKYLTISLLFGILSVLTWVITSDLRFYFWVQFSSFITIPFILLLFPSRYTKKTWYIYSLGLYALAKWAEVRDREIFLGTRNLISGHSLKHILAAMGLATLWWMVKTRKEKEVSSTTTSSRSVTDATW